MFTLSIVALVLSIVTLVFTIALCEVALKLSAALEKRILALESAPTHTHAPLAEPRGYPHNPAGPSGHAFHGHPHVRKVPESQL